eukprot:TRINITY_DN1892_c0_g1_i9.p1 TRINITY_DN1892_c0_g1~~TRINITY_DN1892_c0_g1_i9.p1  ORF type:complete len:194 (-),score=23.31 TRINITY_DN1892_c0_g1_i9:507-1088(-)
MRELYQKFDLEAAKEIKAEEAVTNHDVKAVEYYVKKQMDKMGLSEYREWVHFALTSQDINNTSIPLALKDCLDKEYRPALNRLMTSLNTMSQEWMGIPMLARTHGQPATPTRLGKELKVFHYRITKQLVLLDVVWSSLLTLATSLWFIHSILRRSLIRPNLVVPQVSSMLMLLLYPRSIGWKWQTRLLLLGLV